MNQTLRISLPSNAAVIADLVEAVAKRSIVPCLSQPESFRLGLCLAELLTNVVQHSYANASDGIIDLQCRVSQRSICLRIRDYGKPFQSAAAPSLLTREGGRGLEIVQSMVTAIRQRRTGQINDMLLIIRR